MRRLPEGPAVSATGGPDSRCPYELHTKMTETGARADAGSAAGAESTTGCSVSSA